MSGSLFDNSATVNAFRGPSGVDIAQKYQDYQNAQANNALIRQNTINAQQNLQNLQSSNALTQANTVNAGITGQRSQVDLGNESQAAIAKSIMALGDDPDNLTSDKVHAAIQQAGEAGHVSPAIVQAWQNNVDAVPTDANGKPTAAGGYTPLLNHALLYAANPELYAKLTQRSQGPDVNSPGGLQGTSRAPVIGSATPNAITPQGQPVAQTVAPQVGTFTRPDGSTYLAPIGSGTGNPGTGSPQPNTAPASAPNIPPASGPPRLNPQPTTNPQTTPGFGTTSLPAGAPTAITGSADAYVAAQKAQAGYPERITTLSNLYGDLIGSDTGPGSQTVQDIKSFLLAHGTGAGIDASKVTDYDMAVKNFARYALAQPGSSQTDMRTTLTEAANGSTHISNPAARQVVLYATGLEKMNNAALTSFQAGGGGTAKAGTWSDYQSSFANKYDPRGFVAGDLKAEDPAAYRKMIQSMSPQDRTKFANTMKFATNGQ